MDWGAVLSGTVGAALVGGLVAVIQAMLGRPLTRASAVEKLSDTALKLIDRAEKSAERAAERADKAMAEAERAEQECADARREAADARRSAEDAAREVRLLKTAILSPTATLERLREMVAEPGPNGSSGARV